MLVLPFNVLCERTGAVTGSFPVVVIVVIDVVTVIVLVPRERVK